MQRNTPDHLPPSVEEPIGELGQKRMATVLLAEQERGNAQSAQTYEERFLQAVLVPSSLVCLLQPPSIQVPKT